VLSRYFKTAQKKTSINGALVAVVKCCTRNHAMLCVSQNLLNCCTIEQKTTFEKGCSK